MDDLRDEREGLQRTRTETFDQQQRGKVPKVLLVCDGEDGAQASQVDIGGANVVVRRHYEPAGVAERFLDRIMRDGEQRTASVRRATIDEVQDGALRLADDGGVGIGNE